MGLASLKTQKSSKTEIASSSLTIYDCISQGELDELGRNLKVRPFK